MSMPFYVAPEQVMADRADYARKGIARGRSLVAVVSDGGIVLCAENPSARLRKINEIYDRIAFGGVGKYNEFDQLRVAGVRHADLKGFEFSRSDVDARSLANQYAQLLGQVFTHEMKPMEVELLVAEVGETVEDDRLFHILYDGTVIDETGCCALGGDAEAVSGRLHEAWRAGLSLDAALAVAVHGLTTAEHPLAAGDLEVAVLARNGARRTFSRWDDAQVATALEAAGPVEIVPAPVAEDASPASPDAAPASGDDA
jgi:proteasome alpha subunit